MFDDLPKMYKNSYDNATRSAYGGGLVQMTTNNTDWDRHMAIVGAIQKEKEMAVPEKLKSGRRLVRVMIVDTDDNVPVADALLYKSEEQFTDKTDDELFYDLDMKELLKAHNAKRQQMINKKVKDRTEYLEPARIRDLSMVVIDLATF